MTDLKPEDPVTRPHAWTKSTLGHGESMCSRCGITNREAAVLGEIDRCPKEEASPPRDYTKLRDLLLGLKLPGETMHILKFNCGPLAEEIETLLADRARMEKAIQTARGILLYPTHDLLTDSADLNTKGVLAAADALLAVESGIIKPGASQ